jgi:hypothetical protein
MSDIPMRRTENDEVPESDEPGVFAWRQHDGAPYLLYVCPRHGSGSPSHLCGVPIAPGKLENGAQWHRSGSLDAPTLMPSVNCVGGCGWHGFITNGVMTNA